MKVIVSDEAGPFVVTSQQSNETIIAGTTTTVTWDVANTDKNPIGAQTVDIFLSTDGGASFPLQLATGVPNDGEHTVLIPGAATESARIMVKGGNTIFFAVNETNFTIAASEIVLNFPTLTVDACAPDDIVIPFVYETFLSFDEEATFSVVGAPAGLNASFSPETSASGETNVVLTLSNTAGVTPGMYSIMVRATTTNITKEVPLEIGIFDNTFTPVVLTAPANGATDVTIAPVFEWEEDPGYAAYDIEIALDAAFTTIVETASVLTSSYTSETLNDNTTYYWRVKPINACGEGAFGIANSFATVPVNCITKTGDNIPGVIASTGTPTISSKINFANDLPISDVNVRLNITHSFLSDLVINLISPSGTRVVLVSEACGDASNLNATFDDSGNIFTCGNNPAIQGLVRPLGSLSSFNGESTLGEWTLEIMDTAASDGGQLNSFELEICVEGEFRPDLDEDGVFDDGDDLCLGTPKGAEVTAEGCPVFRFATNNFAVAAESESCANNNNGSITVTASEILSYSVTVSGNGINETADFTEEYKLSNLRAGTYSLCITGTDGMITYEEFCFDVVVNEPEPLGVTSRLSENGAQAILTLAGSDLYTIELNGTVTTTALSEITVDLISGNNVLKVSTELPCQGTYDETIFVTGKALLYPNPVVATTTLNLGSNEAEEVQISIHGLNGQLISLQTYEVNNAEVVLNTAPLATGTYIIRFNGRNTNGTIKMVKQ